MKDGLFALPALKILEIRLVFVNKAAYTTVKQKPAANLSIETKNYISGFLKIKIQLKKVAFYI